MVNVLNRCLHRFRDLVYPPKCPFCDAFVDERSSPCPPCSRRLTRLESDAVILLDVKRWFKSVRSCFSYEGIVKDLIHSFKYSGRLDHVAYLVRCLEEASIGTGPFDLIATVPMQNDRLVSRGFDHCALVANAFGRASSVHYERGLIVRGRSVPPQVGLKREERMKNVRGVFAVKRGFESGVKERGVLLIDDVLTTGATLNDCARALIKGGAREVSALTLARTL